MGSTPSKKTYKPINIYAIAAGYYPIIPSSNKVHSSTGFSITQHYSKDYRAGAAGKRPVMWKENKVPKTAYTQGNWIFQTRQRYVQNFSGPNSMFLERNKQTFRDIRNELAPRARTMSSQMAKAMNVKLGGNYRKLAGVQDGKVPASMGETHTKAPPGTTVTHTKKIDSVIDGKVMNITAARIGDEGHGQYGSGRRQLLSTIKSIEASDMSDKQQYKAKAEAGRQYFKNRIPEWNRHIKMIKKDQGIDDSKRATKKQRISFAKAFKAHGNVKATMANGLKVLNEDWGTSGHFYKGSKQMTSQLLGNPDLLFTKEGVWESVVISDYTFASFGPFRTRMQGKRKFEFYEKLNAHVHRGYDMSVLFGKTLRSGLAAQAAIRNKMGSFITATHNVNRTPVRINAMNRVTSSSLLTGGDKAVSLRPEVNLVQAGNAYNRAIDRMMKNLKKSTKGVPRGVRDVLQRNRFKIRHAGSLYTSIWAAPYISIFDVKSMGAGYNAK